MVLTEILEKNRRDLPKKIALSMRMGYRTVSLSYEDVYSLALKTAFLLQQNGLKKGDKVLIIAPNSPYWICAFWGCLLGGFIPVPLNIQSTGETVRKIIDQTRAKIAFKHLHFIFDFPDDLKIYNIEFLKESVADADVSKFNPPDIFENDIAEIMYTSGTTGDPKGVILTHKNIFSNLKAIQNLAPLAEKDKFLSILPLSHIFEQVVGFLMPFSGGSPIIYSYSPAAIPDLLKEHRISVVAAVPEFLRIVMARIEAEMAEGGRKIIFKKLLNFSEWLSVKRVQRAIFKKILKQFGGKLHTVISGGAPLDPELEKKWSALGVYLMQGYGLTETSPVVSTNNYTEYRLGSVGKVLPGVNIKIASDGEIMVKGPNVFRGYYKDEKKTKESFTDDGWFMTGDIGELDKNGFLYIRGRKKYMIKGPGAQNVYPEDIEFELNKIAGVRDSAIVGLERFSGHIEIHAVLLLNQAFKSAPDSIVEEANKRLAFYQRIMSWSVWPQDDFPRSATRKIKKEEVLKWLKEKPAVSAEARPEEKATPLKRLLAEITDKPLNQIRERAKIVPELNLDSLLRIELVSRVEEKFGIAIDEASIDFNTTVSDIEKMLKRREPAKKPPALKKWPRFWTISASRIFGQRLFIFPAARLFVKLKVEGLENLKGLALPAIFMPNHISYLDSLILAMALPFPIGKRLAFAAAHDVLYGQYKKIAWLGELYFNTFPFPRKERENIKAGLDYFGRILDDGWSVAVYPEGQMSLAGNLMPLKRGAGLIAVEMDSCVVPVKILGTAEIVPYGKFLPRKRGTAIVRFGKPLKFKRSDSYIEATRKIEEALNNL